MIGIKPESFFYYGGLVQIMPIYACFFFVLVFANFGFPGTASFTAELLIIFALFSVSPLVCLIAAFGLIFGAVYMIWLFNRVFFGPLRKDFLLKFSDLNEREFFLMALFVFLIVFCWFVSKCYLSRFPSIGFFCN